MCWLQSSQSIPLSWTAMHNPKANKTNQNNIATSIIDSSHFFHLCLNVTCMHILCCTTQWGLSGTKNTKRQPVFQIAIQKKASNISLTLSVQCTTWQNTSDFCNTDLSSLDPSWLYLIATLAVGWWAMMGAPEALLQRAPRCIPAAKALGRIRSFENKKIREMSCSQKPVNDLRLTYTLRLDQ